MRPFLDKFRPKPAPGRDTYTDLITVCSHAYPPGEENAEDYALFFEQDGIRDYLASLGLRKFAPLVGSGKSMVLEIADGQVIRFEFKNEETGRTKTVHQIQPIHARTMGSAAFEVLPKLKADVPEDLEQRYGDFLHSQKYALLDFKPSVRGGKGDAGYMRDGTLQVIDKQGFLKACAAEQGTQRVSAEWIDAHKEWLSPMHEGDKESIFPWLHGTGYISRQERIYPAIADGRIRGVLSDADIARLKAGELDTVRREKPECFTGVTAQNLDEFVGLVKNEGWYPSQARQIMHERGTLDESPSKAVNTGGARIVGKKISLVQPAKPELGQDITLLLNRAKEQGQETTLGM